ncbi:unnamed protein product, partial [Effrenium voratum]
HFPKTGVRGNPWRLRPFDKWRRPNQGSVRRHSMSFCLMRSRRHRQDWSLHKAVHGNRLLAMPLDQHVAFRRCGLALRLQACIEPLILRALEAFGSKRLHSPNAQLALMLRLLCVLALGLAPVFLTPNSTSPTPRPEAPARTKATTPGPAPAHGDASSEDNGRVPHMLRVAAASLLALLVALVPLSAEAARSGGRMGGRSSAPRSAFRAAPRPRAVPRSEPHFGGPNVSIGIGPPAKSAVRKGGTYGSHTAVDKVVTKLKDALFPEERHVSGARSCPWGATEVSAPASASVVLATACRCRCHFRGKHWAPPPTTRCCKTNRSRTSASWMIKIARSQT